MPWADWMSCTTMFLPRPGGCGRLLKDTRTNNWIACCVPPKRSLAISGQKLKQLFVRVSLARGERYARLSFDISLF